MWIDIKNDYTLRFELLYAKSEQFYTSINQLQKSKSSIVIDTSVDIAFKS